MNGYNAKFFILVERNRLLESENQPKSLQVKGLNLLAIVHDLSSHMAECKET